MICDFKTCSCRIMWNRVIFTVVNDEINERETLMDGSIEFIIVDRPKR